MKKTKKMFFNRILALLMALAMILTGIPATGIPTGIITAEAASVAEDNNLAENIQDGTILHCWCWSFNTIKENMADIAAAGFSTIQTSPANTCNATHTNMKLMGSDTVDGTDGCWWWHYQPTDWKIGNYQLGTRDDFKAMCQEADKYGIKVIVDVIPNHTTPDLNEISQDFINAVGGMNNLFHENGFRKIQDYGEWSWGNRLACTTGMMGGLPDVNTENPDFQAYFLKYLNDLIECGADGFRYDTAKHIGAPSDPVDPKSSRNNFWPVATGKESVKGITLKDKDRIFTYGEVLQDTGVPETEYSQYMHMTASSYGQELRNAVQSKSLNAGNLMDWRHSTPTHLVTWAESHDNYCNDGSYKLTNTQIRLAYAVIAARANGTPLFFNRPAGSSPSNMWGNNVLGVKGNDEFKSPEVSAVNFFRNAMTGQPETLRNPGNNSNVLQIDRGTLGTCIINVGYNDVTLSDAPTSMADGDYTDQVSGSKFTVAGGKLSGKVGRESVAVVYNATDWKMTAKSASGSNSFSSNTLEVTLGSNKVTNTTYTTSEGVSGNFENGDVITIGSNTSVGGSITVTLNGQYEGQAVSIKAVFNKIEPNIAYIELPSGWSAPRCYVYNKAGATNAVWEGAGWDDIVMERVEGNLYRYVVPDSIENPLVIFYGGDNSHRYPADLEDGLSLGGSMIYKNGTWKKYDGPVITITPTVTPTVTPTDIPGRGNVAYIELPSGWSEPYCYAYSKTIAKLENAAWPGVKMEKVSGNLYKYEVPDNISDPLVIFYGGDNSRRYPADMQDGLTLSGNMIYKNGNWSIYSEGPTPTVDPGDDLVDGSYDVYIKKPSGWGSNLNCYAYVNETLNNGAWPGVSMVNLGSGIYAYNMPEGWTSANVIFNDGGSQIPGAQQPGLDWTDGTSMIYKDGSWVKVESKKKLDIVSSLADGSTFDTESETITLTLKNAVSGTYCVDDGPVKEFTDSAKVVIGQGKIADSDVKVKVTATNGTETKEVTFTYHKKFDAKKNGGYTQYEISAKAAAATVKAAGAAVTKAASSESLGGKYATNPNSQKGKYKTISSAADFDESMIIAQGVANDDARTFRGTHEGPVYDTYALYGAWDDTNLYLGWQFVNVTDVVDPAQGYPISDNGKPWNGDIPQVLALDLGTGVTSDGSAKGTDEKTGTVNYSDYVWGLPIKYDTAVDALLCFSSKPGVGQPALFRADTDGYFNYDTAVGFKEGGISFKYEDGFFGSSLYGIKANGYEGYKPADLMDASANWTDFLTTNHSKAQDTFYVMTIPLTTLGVSKNDIEKDGIGVMHISTFGMSGTACIPMDMTMLDHATDPYSHDDSTTAEKEDEDRITVPLARLGAEGSTPPTTPTPTSTPTPTPPVGSTGTMTVNFGADRSSPQATTTALTLKAIAEGGNGTYTYQFLVDGKEVQNSGKDTYTWTPRSGEHTIGVKVTDGNGIVTECSKTYVGEGEDPYQPITIKSFTAEKQSPQVKGTSVRFDVAAEGGNGTLQYRFYRVINGKTTVFRDYGTGTKAYCNPAVGTYTICVDVKDEDGNVETAQMNYTWKEPVAGLTITSFTADKVSPQEKGVSVRFDVASEGGNGTVQYRFYRVINGKTTVFRNYGTGTKAYCNPPAEGTYTIYVDAKDADGTVVTKQMTYTWGKTAQGPVITSFTADKVSPQQKGTSVRFDVAAEGGNGTLQYRFYRVVDGKTTVFRDYGTGTKAYCNPPAEGTYTICVDVKDADGNVATKQMTYVWGNADQEIVIKSFKADKVSPQAKGTSVCLNVEAEGGTGDLQYRFYRIGNGKTTVFREYGAGSKAYCNPAAGTYIIYVDVKDSKGNVRTESMLYQWN